MTLSVSQRKIVYHFASVIIPDLNQNTSLESGFIVNFEKLFFGFDPDTQKKLKLFISLISLLSFFYTARSFENLSFEKRQDYIERLFKFPINKIISALTGLRTLCFISYYSLKEVWTSINYDGPIISK